MVSHSNGISEELTLAPSSSELSGASEHLPIATNIFIIASVSAAAIVFIAGLCLFIRKQRKRPQDSVLVRYDPSSIPDPTVHISSTQGQVANSFAPSEDKFKMSDIKYDGGLPPGTPPSYSEATTRELSRIAASAPPLEMPTRNSETAPEDSKFSWLKRRNKKTSASKAKNIGLFNSYNIGGHDSGGFHTRGHDSYGHHLREHDSHGHHLREYDSHGHHLREYDSHGHHLREHHSRGRHITDHHTIHDHHGHHPIRHHYDHHEHHDSSHSYFDGGHGSSHHH